MERRGNPNARYSGISKGTLSANSLRLASATCSKFPCQSSLDNTLQLEAEPSHQTEEGPKNGLAPALELLSADGPESDYRDRLSNSPAFGVLRAGNAQATGRLMPCGPPRSESMSLRVIKRLTDIRHVGLTLRRAVLERW